MSTRTQRAGRWARLSWPLVGGLLPMAGACTDVPTAPTTAGGAIQMSVVAAGTNYVRCGEEIGVKVVVTDGRRPLGGFLVNFRVLGGGGSMYAGSALTDTKGVAKDYWTVGGVANLENTLAVHAVDPTTGAKASYFSQTVTTWSKIAFVRPLEPGIYVMNPDGSAQTRLTTTGGMPAWSADGGKIAFESYPDALYSQIYVMNADGTNPTRLTTNAANNHHPAWSPDGGKIAFGSGRDGNAEIYVMNADGTNPTQLTTSGNNRSAAWSPDGRKIVFESVRDGAPGIFLMNADGSGQTRLTAGSDVAPAWSPDGGKIVFDSYRDDTNAFAADIYVMNADGTNLTRLTTNGTGATPVWAGPGCTSR